MARRRLPPIPKLPQPKAPTFLGKRAGTPGFPRGPKGSQVLLVRRLGRENIPPWFSGTLPEWLAKEALDKLGYKMVNDPRPSYAGTDYVFQDPALGSFVGEAGSTIVDLVVYAEFPPIALPVQGEFWHPLFGPRYEKDMEIFRRLRDELGWTVIPLDEDDLLNNALYVVRAAVIERRNLSRYHNL